MPFRQTSVQLKHTSLLVSFEYCPGAQSTHVRSVVLLGVFEARSPAGQDVHCWQMVSIDAVPLSDAKEFTHTECGSHAAALVRLLNECSAQSAHARFSVADGSLVECVPGTQSAHGWQMVSIDAVPLMDAKEPPVQAVCASHLAALVRLLNVFAPHVVQILFTAAEGAADTCVPGPQSFHCWQEAARVDGANDLVAHSTQAVLLSLLAYLPISHSTHTSCSVALANVPFEQLSHCACPARACARPIAHFAHSSFPAWSCARPPGHCPQPAMLRVLSNLPAGHAMHVLSSLRMPQPGSQSPARNTKGLGAVTV